LISQFAHGEWLAKKVTAEGKANDPTNALIFLQTVMRTGHADQ
jgi:hypothetical protein